jgi:hypothetical protein
MPSPDMGLSFSKQVQRRRPFWIVIQRFLSTDGRLSRHTDGSVVQEMRYFTRAEEAHAYAQQVVGSEITGRLCFVALVRFGGGLDALAD